MAMTEYWRMGATPVPATEIAGFARRFEEWGWDGMAVGEAHGLLPDPYVVLAPGGRGDDDDQGRDGRGRPARGADARRRGDGDPAGALRRPRTRSRSDAATAP